MNQKKLTNHASVGKHPDRLSHPALAAGRIGHAEEPSDHRSGGFSRTLRNLLLPLAVTAATGLVSVTATTAVAGRSPDPTALIPALSALSLALASFAGGLTAGLCNRASSLAGSLISGGLLTALLCLIGLLSGGESAGNGGVWSAFPPIVAWLIRLAPLPIHALGGILTRPRPQKVTHTTGGHPARR